MRGGSKRKLDASIGESREEHRDARKGLCGGKVRTLECRLLDGKFRTWYGKLSPGMEDFAGLNDSSACGVPLLLGRHDQNGGGTYFRTRTALKLGFDFPWERWLAMFVKNHVIALRVDVFRVNEETIHVEKAGAHTREAMI